MSKVPETIVVCEQCKKSEFGIYIQHWNEGIIEFACNNCSAISGFDCDAYYPEIEDEKIASFGITGRLNRK